MYATQRPLLLGCTTASMVLSLAHGADHYAVTDLGTLGDATAASSINAHGVAAGYAVDLLYRYHGFTSDNGVFSTITTMGPNSQAQAIAITDTDQTIVASYMLGNLSSNAWIYENGMPMMIAEFMPQSVNTSLQIVGSKFVTAPGGYQNEQACLWEMGSLIMLDQLNGGSHSIAKSLNNSGWAVGSATRPAAIVPTATLWVGTTPTDLGTLGGAWSQAHDINNANEVVGISQISNGDTHAFRYTLDGSGGVITRKDLGVLAQQYSSALAINDAGIVVGTSDNRAFVWEDGTMSDLNTLIDAGSPWILNTAKAINESGQIVGVGSLAGDPFRAFLLTPTDVCPPDLTHDGILNLQDVFAYLKLFNSSDPTAEMTNDNTLNLQDLFAYLDLFNAGCPTKPTEKN